MTANDNKTRVEIEHKTLLATLYKFMQNYFSKRLYMVSFGALSDWANNCLKSTTKLLEQRSLALL